MTGQVPKYLGIVGEDGDGWKALVWDDPEGELERIRLRIDAGEIFTSVADSRSWTREVTLNSPVASCRLFALEPVAISGTLIPGRAAGGLLQLQVPTVPTR